MEKALAGIVVVEQAGRLAASICGALLRELGAQVVRVETHESDIPDAAALAWAGKDRLVAPTDSKRAASFWQELAARADILIVSPGGRNGDPVRPIIDKPPPTAVICVVSAHGRHASQDEAVADWMIQAESGFMAVTGEPGGCPEPIRLPIFEVFAGINAAAAALAALRVARRDGAGQIIDMALFDTAFAMLGTHIAPVVAGSPRGHRVGCRHPLCAPWDVYRCGDDWVQICIASEAQWQRFTKLMERPEIANDPRFANAGSRVTNVRALNEIVEAWLSGQDSSAVTRKLTEIGVPAAKVARIDDVLAAARAGHCLVDIVDPTGALHPRMRSVLRLSRSPGLAPNAISGPREDFDEFLAELPVRRVGSAGGPAKQPLDGIRIIEIGPYTAGPLAGRYLVGIGAQVLKVEPPGGEDSRRFRPQFGRVSGFFSNYNWGKRAICLDLQDDGDRDRLVGLIEDADIVLQSLKPGALDRLGIDLRRIGERKPALIVCSISGYGADGPGLPALDTVVQAQSGLMSCVGTGSAPIKAGFSLADLVAAHVAPLAVLAALHYRDRTGEGQQIDIAMLDCLIWVLQPVWGAQGRRAPILRVVKASDGYVSAAIKSDEDRASFEQIEQATDALTRSGVVARLRATGLEAAAVLELDEVINHPLAAQRRRLVQLPIAPAAVTPIIASPYGLELTPPVIGRPISGLEEETGAVWGTHQNA